MNRNTKTKIEFPNSRVTIERGQAGAVARIERDQCTDYAGPLPQATISALEELAQEVSA